MRWLMAIAWVTMRLVLVAGFFYVVWRDWSSIAVPARVAALLLGPFLALFNVGGLFKVILPGMPWLPDSKGTKQR